MAIRNRNVKLEADISLAKIDITQTPRSTHLYLQLPEVANASLPAAASGNEGGVSYDATNNTVVFSDGASWANIASVGSAETLNASYDAGNSIDIDAAGGDLDITYAAVGSRMDLDVNTASAVTDGIIFRTSDAGGSFVDAMDCSDDGITNALNIGGANIVGTALDLDGNNGAILAQSLDRFSAGTMTIGGSTATALTLTPATTIAGALTCSAAVTMSAGLTQSGGNVSLTGSATTGNAVLLDGSTVTTGNVLRIEYDAANSGAGFGAIEVTEDASAVWTVGEDGNQVIAGTATGTAALTLTAGDLVLSDGGLDLTQSSGDALDIIPPAAGAVIDANLPGSYNLAGGAIDIDGSTGSGPVVEIAMSSTYTGDYLSLNMSNAVGAKCLDITGAGTRTVQLIHVTDTPSTLATFDLDITPAGAQANANVFDIDIAGTGSASVIAMNFAAAYTGDALNIDMTNAVAANAIELTGAGTRTVPLFVVTDVPTTSAPTFDINITPAASVQAGFDIDVAGTSGADILAIDFSAAHVGDAINITMTNCGAAAQALVVDGGQTAADGNIVSISSSSAFAGGTGRLVALSSTGALAVATDGAVLDIAETGAAQATSYALQINSTNNESLIVDTGKSRFDEEVTFKASNRESVNPNFAQAAGSANAITAALTDSDAANVALADGLSLLVDLNSRTLQAGANTLDFNGGGAVSIVSCRNIANNIGTAYAANGFVRLVYNSTSSVWMDMSQ